MNETKQDQDMVLIGQCAVDSGTLMIIDPCYTDPEGGSRVWPPIHTDDSWPGHMEILGATRGENHAGPICRDLAVASTTKYGDGLYNVYLMPDHNALVVDFDGFHETWQAMRSAIGDALSVLKPLVQSETPEGDSQTALPDFSDYAEVANLVVQLKRAYDMAYGHSS